MRQRTTDVNIEGHQVKVVGKWSYSGLPLIRFYDLISPAPLKGEMKHEHRGRTWCVNHTVYVQEWSESPLDGSRTDLRMLATLGEGARGYIITTELEPDFDPEEEGNAEAALRKAFGPDVELELLSEGESP